MRQRLSALSTSSVSSSSRKERESPVKKETLSRFLLAFLLPPTGTRT